MYYERVEPVAEIWGSLDRDTDGRLDDFDHTADCQGFHKLERLMSAQNTLVGIRNYADQLLADVRRLRTLVGQATYQPGRIS